MGSWWRKGAERHLVASHLGDIMTTPPCTRRLLKPSWTTIWNGQGWKWNLANEYVYLSVRGNWWKRVFILMVMWFFFYCRETRFQSLDNLFLRLSVSLITPPCLVNGNCGACSFRLLPCMRWPLTVYEVVISEVEKFERIMNKKMAWGALLS